MNQLEKLKVKPNVDERTSHRYLLINTSGLIYYLGLGLGTGQGLGLRLLLGLGRVRVG